MTRRCGVQLPSGRSCPTFLSREQNVCAKHALDTHGQITQGITYAQKRYPPLILPPRRSLSGRIIDWILTKA